MGKRVFNLIVGFNAAVKIYNTEVLLLGILKQQTKGILRVSQTGTCMVSSILHVHVQLNVLANCS